MVMRGATSVDAHAAEVMSVRTRWGSRWVFHFEGVLERGGDGREDSLVVDLMFTEGTAASRPNWFAVIVC